MNSELPNEEILDKLIELAESAEQTASNLYQSATEIDEKWRIKLDKRKIALQQLKSSTTS